MLIEFLAPLFVDVFECRRILISFKCFEYVLLPQNEVSTERIELLNSTFAEEPLDDRVPNGVALLQMIEERH